MLVSQMPRLRSARGTLLTVGARMQAERLWTGHEWSSSAKVMGHTYDTSIVSDRMRLKCRGTPLLELCPCRGVC